MRYRSFAALILSLALLTPTVAGGQTGRGDKENRPNATDLGANAAMKYWQAFALLPNLDKDQEKLLEDWNKVPLDAAALKLIEKGEPSREYLGRAAKLQRCDWSLDYDDGIWLRMPFLGKALTLARLTALHARHEFKQGRWKSGWTDVTAVFYLGRHVEMAETFITRLVGYRIERMAMEAAAPYLPESKSGLPENAAADLDRLPAAPTIQQIVRREKEVGPAWLLQRIKTAEQQKPGAWQEVWNEVFDAIISSAEGRGPNRDSVNTIKNYEEATKALEGLLPLFDQLTKLVSLPPKEFDAQYPEFVKKAKAANPLAEYLLPNMNNFVPGERRLQTQIALFKAALAIVQGGQDKVNDIKDPFGAGPFEYRPLNKGFELKSKLLYKGEPVTLVVGQVKKD
ncbi:MAG: hypothetical protein ACJ8FY_14545 [Gemmataceae bacterium]